MKKSRKTLLTALTLMSSVSMTSCYAVYGPPPDDDIFSSSSGVSVTEEENTTKEVTADIGEEYNPAYEEQANVYGPPPDMD